MQGHSGISPVYDAIRSLAARLRGQRFSLEHSDTLSPQWKDGKGQNHMKCLSAVRSERH